MSVDVKQISEEDARPGGDIVPRDGQRRINFELNRKAGVDLKQRRDWLAQQQKERYEKGKELMHDARPETYGEMAIKLLQAGDYGVGSPFPLTETPPPAWRRKGPELAHMIREDEKVELDKFGGKSAEHVRCFRGLYEFPCGTTDLCVHEQGLVDPALAGPALAASEALYASSVVARRTRCSDRASPLQASAFL